MINVPEGASIGCDWLGLRRVPPGPTRPGLAGSLGPLVVLPSGELWGPSGECVGLLRWPEFGGEHIALRGEFWRDGELALRGPELVDEWSAGAETVSCIRVDWVAELGRLWAYDEAEELADVVELRDQLAEQLTAQGHEPRSGWAKGQFQNDAGSTAELGVMGRDSGKGKRGRDPYWRIYTDGARERHRVRVEVERKDFPGRPVLEVLTETANEAAAAIGLPVHLVRLEQELPAKKQRAPLERLASQARGMVSGALVRQGERLSPELRAAFRVIDKACGVSVEETDARERRWSPEAFDEGPEWPALPIPRIG